MVAKQLAAAGFDAAAQLVTSSQLSADLSDGNFDGTVLDSASGPSPYYIYENWLDPALLAKGRTGGSGDYERFGPATDPSGAATVTKALQQYVDNPSDSASGSGGDRGARHCGVQTAAGHTPHVRRRLGGVQHKACERLAQRPKPLRASTTAAPVRRVHGAAAFARRVRMLWGCSPGELYAWAEPRHIGPQFRLPLSLLSGVFEDSGFNGRKRPAPWGRPRSIT